MPTAQMSFFRHEEIYRPGVGFHHRCDEFPSEYSLASCSPAEPRMRFLSFPHAATNNPVVELIRSPGGRASSDAFPQEMKNHAVKNLKRSMDLCDREFLLLNDSQLNEVVAVQGTQRVTKADVMMDLVGDVAKAESEMDTYLKLSGIASGTNVR